MFKKVLIANRGAIACRIIRTLKRMGIHSVAVYSEADKHSLHVMQADEAICIGAAPASESYLKQEVLLAAAAGFPRPRPLRGAGGAGFAPPGCHACAQLPTLPRVPAHPAHPPICLSACLAGCSQARAGGHAAAAHGGG